MRRASTASLVLAAILLILPSLAGAESRPDAWITMKAKTALYVAEDVRGKDVHVDTNNGRVTLHGRVRSETEKKRAEEEVRKVAGVVDVRNLLQVVAPTVNDVVKVSDDVIKADVEQALKADHSLDDSNISVKSVSKGVVVLGGKAASPHDNLRALYCASNRPGVVRAASEIEVPDTFDDNDFHFDSDEAKGEAIKRNPGGVMSDLWITSAIKMKLAADDRTPATEINVDTYDGVVTLFGMAPTQEAQVAAAEIARKVAGVKSVDNQIEVVAPRKQDAVKIRDEQILKDVETVLNDRGHQDDADIKVEVTNGVVRLSGTVSTWQNNLSAVYAARAVTGVRSVRNDLRVVTVKAEKP